MVRKKYAGIAVSSDSGCEKECCGGSSPDEVRQILEEQGFEKISITREDNSDLIIRNRDFGNGTEQMVFSAYIRAARPERREAASEN